MLEPKQITISGGVLALKHKWIADRDKILAEAKAITEVASAKQISISAGIQAAMGKHTRELAKERKAVTGPIDAVKREIMDQEKAMVYNLNLETRRLKTMNDRYATEQAIIANKVRKEQEEAEHRRMMEAAEKQRKVEELFGAEAVAVQEPAPEPAPVVPEKPALAGSNRVVKRWSFTIQNVAQVPREYLIIDDKKLRAHVTYCEKMGNDPDVPGVVFEARMSVEGR